jgi:D-alanyl-D-alanine carboxypeptidase
MLKRVKSPKKRIHFYTNIVLVLLCVGTAFVWLFVLPRHASNAPALSPTQSATKVKTHTDPVVPPAAPAPTPTPQPLAVKPASTFDSAQYSTSSPASIWVIANKSHPLTPLDYAPSDLVTSHGGTVRTVVSANLDQMLSDAQAQGITITIISSYRSYSYQTSLYNNYVNQYGQVSADTFSARPGYSEHQTGLALDFGSTSNPGCNLDECYADTSEGLWLAEHAHTYGFLLRYTAEKQTITGYKAEPWHYRYIGDALAAEMKARSVTTLEEFFGISGGQTYLQ